MARTVIGSRPRRTAWRVGLAAAAVLLGGACSSQDLEPTPSPSETVSPSTETASPSPSPSPTPEPTPTETATLTVEEQHIEEAKQTIRDYIDATNRVGRREAGLLETLPPFWGTPEVSDPNLQAHQSSIDAGEYMTGTITVAWVESTAYVPDPSGSGYEQSHLRYCVDYSQRTLHNADGSEIAAALPPRFVWTALMQHQAGAQWTINQSEGTDETC